MLDTRKFLLTFAFTISFILCRDSVLAGQDDQRLIRKMDKVLAKHGLPAVFVAAARSDEILTTLCRGVRKRGSQDQVDLNDRIALGSNTKSMTATLAGVIVEAGRIKWDTTISDVWPELNDQQLHPELRNATLADLLSHQSGIRRDFGGDQWVTFFAEEQSPREERLRMLKMCLKDQPKATRGKYLYSNLGYVVAAAMLETVTDEDFESLMHRCLFGPLKMDSADFWTRNSAMRSKPPLLWGHLNNGTPISPKTMGSENPSVYASAGTVHLTMKDYAKYAQWHLSENPDPVLKKKTTIEQLHCGMVSMGAGKPDYGNGWIHFPWPQGNQKGRAMQHTGSNTNSFALIWVLPDQDLAAIVWTNTYEPSHFTACDELIAEIFAIYSQ